MSDKKQYISARVDPKTAAAFRKAAEKHGGGSTVLKYMIEGFIEDRVVIAPPKPPELFKSFSDLKSVVK